MNDEQTIQLKALVNEQRTNKNVASSSPHSQFLMIVLLSIICSLIPVSNCLDRNGKLIFSVIRFPNAPCVGSGGFNGTCYTASECSAKGTFLPYFWILYFFLSFFDFTFLQRNWVFSHKLKFSESYVFAAWCCKSFIFQTNTIWSNTVHSLKYLRSTTLVR